MDCLSWPTKSIAKGNVLVNWGYLILTLTHTFGENLPFTGLDATVCRELIPELVEEILHFLPTLALSELVGDSELRGAGVGG